MKSCKIFLTFCALIFLQGSFQEPVPPPGLIVAISEQDSNIHRKQESDEEDEETTESNMNDDTLQLPPGLKPFEIQLAGHVFDLNKNQKLGVLEDSDGNLLKPKPTDYEVKFYDTVNASTPDDHILEELKQYIPKYFGTKEIKIRKKVIKFLHLENIMKGFELPCSMDVKIGLKRRPSWFPKETIQQRLRYIAMMKPWGFGIPGFEYYNVLDKTYRQEGKEYGYRLTQRQGIQTLYDFVNGEAGFKCGLVASILDQLRKIADWFQRQRHFRFYDSSVLLTYDAKMLIEYSSVDQLFNHVGERKTRLTELKQQNVQDMCQRFDHRVRVRMLDFGKVVPDTTDEVDTNYYFGLNNLISIVEELNKMNPDIREVLLNKRHVRATSFNISTDNDDVLRYF